MLDSSNGGREPVARGECPEPEVWNYLAAGLLSGDVTGNLLEHLSVCRNCSVLLNEALEDLKSDVPLEPEIQNQLKTSQPKRQEQIARKIISRRFREGANQLEGALTRTFPQMFRLQWVWWAAVALLVVAAGTGFFWLRPNSVEKLLAQAYANQRTLELRIPGAHYGALQVQRGPAHSQHNSSSALLEAEFIIKRKLEKQPQDPDLLRQQAEADLLNWDFQLAIETLGHALRAPHPSAFTLVDLASAHFERAESTDSPADYEMALHYLGEAIRQSPKDRSALFNRAIVYERLFLYGPAIADWESLLAMEEDPKWRNEEESRLSDLRLKYQRHNPTGGLHQLFSAPEMQQALQHNEEADAEEYLKTAERELLPRIPGYDREDIHYRAAMLAARYLQRTHNDIFLSELLRSVDARGFREAAQLLAEASTQNDRGQAEQAYLSARKSARLFQELGSPSGRMAAEFEEAYALHFQTQAGACATLAAKVTSGAHQHNYPWLETQSLLENAICTLMKNDSGAAKVLVNSALQIARAHNYQSFYLRGLLMLSYLEAGAGDEASAWSAIREGLQMFWSARLPAMRGYSLYTALETMAEHSGHDNVQFAAASQALSLISGGSDRTLEASTRSRLAAVALRLGETKIAEEQFARAVQLFSSLPQTDSVRWRMIEAEIWRAKAQSVQRGYNGDSLAVLQGFSPEVKRLSNRVLDFNYYNTLAEIQWKAGDREAAEQSLRKAIDLAESGLRSLTTWPERLTWMSQHRSPYLLLTELMFRSGRQQAALEIWQRFRSAAARPSEGQNTPDELDTPVSFRRPALTSGQPLNTEQSAILTYAFTADGVLLWVREQHGFHSVYVPVRAADLARVAENFLEECSRPDSNLAMLHTDAQSLYTWLIAPASRWLPATGSIILEPDGILNMLPVEALVDEHGAYLGTRYSVTMALARELRQKMQHSSPLVRSSDRALFVAAPIASGANLEPPALALREAERIAGKFLNPEVLSGSEATFAAVKKELSAARVFHFAGHATVGRDGAAIVMADGIFGIAGTRLRGRHGLDPQSERTLLRNIKLAVFSACATAKPSEALQAESLATEFLQAGVPWVTASRWNVDSVATATFMVSFYDSLLSGHTVDSALHLAAREVGSSPAWRHPYYWAAFGAFGHSRGTG
ncbi:MAG TPA: CHAT domain-containing protein [Candidatus Solibacter sp.]|nr:CHAT domain-containing protein [Candidatus Solibacter sp.]